MTGLVYSMLIASWNRCAAAWATAFLHGLATATLLTLLVYLATLAARQTLKPRLRAGLWWLLALKLALVPLGFCLPTLPVALLPAPVWTDTAVSASGLGADASAITPAEGTTSPSLPALLPVPPSALRPTVVALLFAVWSGAVMLQIGGALCGAWRLKRVVRTASPADQAVQRQADRLRVALDVRVSVRVQMSSTISTPLVTGVFRPVILLPPCWAEPTELAHCSSLGLVLAHELAHVRRGDLWAALVPWAARVFCIGVPFLPGFIARQWETAREIACDELALRVTQTHPGAYARVLLAVTNTAHPRMTFPLALGATGAFHALHARLQYLRSEHPRNNARSRGALVVFVAALILAGFGLLPWRLVAASSAQSASALSPALPFAPQASDIADIPAFDLRAEGDHDKRYLLLGTGLQSATPSGQIATTTPPPGGFKLLLVLPGGDGSADYNAFVRRVAKRVLGSDYVVAQPVAKAWSAQQSKQIVWPTRTHPWPGMRWTTEDFAAAVIRDTARRLPINPSQVYVLGWASGGPAAYAIAADKQVPVRGAFLALSVYPRNDVSDVSGTKNRRIFLLHPTQAPVAPLADARRAAAELNAAGAVAELVPYAGGYGLPRGLYDHLNRGVRFLEGTP